MSACKFAAEFADLLKGNKAVV